MKKLLLIVLLIFTMAACSQNSGNENESRSALIKDTDPAPVEIQSENSKVSAMEVKKDIASLPELYDVAVIKGKEDILVAYKVKHLKRFKMKQIEKTINKKLESKYPNENFTVSSDYKIFLESVRLKENIKEKRLNDKEAEKELQQIIKLKEETT